LISFLSFVATTAFEKIPGAGLEGCLSAKNNQQKTARIIQCPDRFLFFLTFLTFFLLTS
jgi:hypothetical protein